jgi:hypothetical protein
MASVDSWSKYVELSPCFLHGKGLAALFPVLKSAAAHFDLFFMRGGDFRCLNAVSSMQRELPVGDGFNATTASTSSLATTNATSSSNVAPGRPEHPYHALVAGAIGGYFVWGRYSSINYQIVLYLTSRVLVGLWKRYWQTHDHDVQKTDWVQTALPDALKQRSYALGAATVWGLVMLLFESNPEVLHPSLKSSMDEIYR